MGLFKRRKEKRNDNSGTVSFEDGLLTAMLGGSSTITKRQALQIPTIAACVNLIADRISSLPIKLYQETDTEVKEIRNDKRLELLNHDTGDTINATEMKQLWICDYFLGKGSYTYIERNMFNEPIGLYYVDESRVAIAPGNDPIHKAYAIQVNGRTYFPYQFLKILRKSKGFGTGTSIIAENPLMLAIYYNTMRFENTNIRKGGNKRGFLKADSTVGDDEMKTLRESWRDLYGNSENSDSVVVLNSGITFQEASSTSVELQLNENKQTNAAEICKLFCVPLDVLNGKASEATISQFVQNCLMPPINKIEAALDHDLLTEAEKAAHYYFAFDTSELTRGDFASRMNAYAVALQNNIYQLDEIREMEDKPPLNFNYMKLGLDTVLLDPKTGQIYTPNTDKTSVLSSATGLTKEEIRGIMMMVEEKRQAVFGEGHKIVDNVPDGNGGGGAGGNSESNHAMASAGGYTPDFSNYEISEDSEGVKRIKEKIVSKLGIPEKDVNLDGLKNAEALEPLVDRMVKIKNETGMSFPPFQTSEVINGDITCIANFRSSEGTNGIFYISTNYFNSKEALSDTLRTRADRKEMPSKARTIAYVAEHETAHMRYHKVDIQTPEAKKIHREFLKTSHRNINDTNIDEFFTDSVAWFRTSPKSTPKAMIEAVEYLDRNVKGD